MMRGFRTKTMTLVLAVAASVFACSEQGTQEPTVDSIQLARGGGGKPPKVNSTDPTQAEQDTTLEVLILGSGYDDGSTVEFTLDGVPSGITTNSTTFISTSELRANITIGAAADTALFDVEVTTTPGKKGVGADLFQVVEKGSGGPNSDPADPQIAFSGQQGITVVDVDGTHITTVVPGSRSTMVDWASSGDGTPANPYHIVFETMEGTADSLGIADIYVDPVTGDAVASNLRVLDLPFRSIHYPAWSPLGNTIAFTGDIDGFSGTQLYLVPSAGGTPVLVYDPTEPTAEFTGYVSWPTWRADNSAVAFQEIVIEVVGEPTAIITLKVLDRLTGTVSTVFESTNGFAPRDLSWGRTGDILLYSFVEKRWRDVFSLELVRDASGVFTAVSAPVKLVGRADRPEWGPNDAQIVYQDARGGNLKILDLVSGSIDNLAPDGSWPAWRR